MPTRAGNGTSDFEAIREHLNELNPEALLADGFEAALVGICHRATSPPLAAYDYGKCVEILMEEHSATYEQAVEYLSFNTIGAYAGENTPVYIWFPDADEA